MRAMVLHQQSPAEQHPLRLEDIPLPTPGKGEVRVRVRVCGVCRTDLHIVEGDIHPPRLPVVPGHQVVGLVDAVGDGTQAVREGDRVGVPWLYSTDGTCGYCLHQQENLCDAGRFTGFDANGGYAEALVVPATSAYPISKTLSDEGAAPLLCAGVIGYRSFRLSNAKPGERIVLIGFGASAHLVLQLALHEKCEVFVMTRSEGHQQLARELGAAWVGNAEDRPPALADSAIVFAPAGALVHSALKVIRKGGTVALAGITMSDIPATPYELLYHEKIVRSVANSTHQDVREFLDLAAQIPIRASVQMFPLERANEALLAMKHSKTEAAAVLRVA
jgi:propanol-preferring alcohol dehydrogenase